ncbi:PAS domain S-box protein [Pedobacter sp. D749]|uniref:sensor histidine kinase n=1 Tax=Pedobacter sp. D749 TaxID=2856523 RepID=UPI001C56EA72|nr:PAS domain S-box protein [Pedobacter sp. D749]QXU42700.1 PAS domain S-box protein [Pedobacter sp. D749]
MIKSAHLPDLFTLQSIFEGIQDAIYCHDLDFRITNWSPAAERMFGYTEQEILGQSVFMLIPDDKYSEKERLMQEVLNDKRISQYRTVRLSRSGKQIPVTLSLSPIKDDKGRIIGMSQIAHDVSFEHQAEEKQSMLAAIIESSEDAIISKTLDGIITTWNKGAEHIFGYSEDEAVGQPITILLPADRLSEEEVIIENIRRGEKVGHIQTIRKTKDGRLLNISLTVSPIKNRDGVVIGASKVARNITSQKESEKLIAKHMERLELLNVVGRSINESLDLQQILQQVTDSTTKLTGAAFGAFFYNQVNQEGESYWLYTISGVPSEALADFPMPRNTALFHPTFSGEGIVRSDDITQDARYGKNAPFFGKPSGHLPVISYLAVPVKTKSGEVIGGLFFGHQEKAIFKKEHEELVLTVASQAAIAIENSMLFKEVQELSAKKDEFIAMASHELKTPMTSLFGFLQLANRNTGEGIAKNLLERAIRQLEKMIVLVSDLFDVSKIHSGKLQLNMEYLNLAILIQEMKESFLQAHPAHILTIEMPEESFVNADRMRLEQVLTNLLNNAVKYATQEKTIELKVQHLDNVVLTSVKDFGPGISEENQRHIFSQFYQAKENKDGSSGLGLGLFISKDIIERHGGQIWVESEPGKGATFNFSLPLA